MENTRNGEADCPGCGDSALARAAKALDDSVVVVPYGQEATVKLPPNVISRTLLQSLERELERSGLDDGRGFRPSRNSEVAATHMYNSARARIGQPQAGLGPFGVRELAQQVASDHGCTMESPYLSMQVNPLSSMLTPKPAQHYRLAMTPGAGLKVQPVHLHLEGSGGGGIRIPQGDGSDYDPAYDLDKARREIEEAARLDEIRRRWQEWEDANRTELEKLEETRRECYEAARQRHADRVDEIDNDLNDCLWETAFGGSALDALACINTAARKHMRSVLKLREEEAECGRQYRAAVEELKKRTNAPE